jgi:K+-transporting ATPase ATPase C chain
MRKHMVVAIKLVLVSALILGILYPLIITAVAQVVFPRQASGSLTRQGSKVIGSALIAQSFIRPDYFHPRVSAAFNPGLFQNLGLPKDTWVSAGSNLGPTSRALAARVRADVKKLVSENPGLKIGEIPADLVTASASGLDPDISPANAYIQATRVAMVRGVAAAEVHKLISQNITPRQFGILGEPRVNVLRLNLALDETKTPKRP